jgi:hypothetical protein
MYLYYNHRVQKAAGTATHSVHIGKTVGRSISSVDRYVHARMQNVN